MDFRPNEELLGKLLEMGVSRNGAMKALYYTGNSNVDAAMSWLFEGKDVDMDTTLEDELKVVDLVSGEESSSSDEEDDCPNYKMVFVINDALKMTPGKISAQVGHATLGLYRHIQQAPPKTFKFGNEELAIWEATYERMIVLKGESTEVLKELMVKAQALNLPHHLVEDAGLTQVDEGSQTVLSIFGEDSEVNKVTGKLKLLA